MAGAGGAGDDQVGAAGDRGTWPVRAAESFSQAPAGGAAGAGRAAGRAVIGVAPIRGGRVRGSDLAAQGEGGDRAAEDAGDGIDHHVAVFLGGDPGQVGDGGVLAEDAGDALEGDQLA